MSIYIFSRPIHSGKTTSLLKWCKQQKNIYGILMPDINESRKIFDLHTKTVFDIECPDALNANEPLISVGNFHFYISAFEEANHILLSALKQKPGWLIIDEVGILELDGKGFYTAIVKAVEFYSDKNSSGNLLITVRDSLCAKVIAFFKLKDYKVIDQLVDIT